MANAVVTLLDNQLALKVLIAVLLVLAFFFSARAVRALFSLVGKKLLAHTPTVLDDRILQVLLAHVRPLMVVVGLHLAVREVRKAATPADLTLNQILDYAEAILYVVIAVLVVKVLLSILRVAVDWYLETLSGEGIADLKATVGPLTGKVVNIIVGLVAVIVILDHFGINIGSLLVSLGVGSLAVALAAQDTLANMIAGFVILVDRPFRVGDRIELSTGQAGDVHSIGLRSTTLVNYDANLIIIPNAELIKGRIVNYSYPEKAMRVLVKVGVAYGTDPEAVRRILVELARGHPDVLKEPVPEVHCTALNDSSIEFTLFARAREYGRQFSCCNELREQAYAALREAGIEMPVTRRVALTPSAS